jgi:phosphoglycolate phosphatase
VFGDWSAAEKFGIQDSELFGTLLLKEVDRMLKQVPLYEGAEDTLIKLKDYGIEVGIVSSSLKEFIEPALRNHGIAGKFNLIIDGNDVKQHKPDPEAVFKALEILKLDPEDILIVGDSKSDIGAAKNAGIKSVLFYPQTHTLFYNKEILLTYNPDYVISQLADLIEIMGMAN